MRLVSKKKRVVIAPKLTLSCNKLRLLSLNTYPHTFSLRGVGVIIDETWTLSPPLPPTVRYVKEMMAKVIWEGKGILLTELMAPGNTITSEVYCETLNKLRMSIQNKQRGCSLKASFSCTTTRDPNRGSHKCFNQALQLGDFRPPSLQSGPGAKRLPSLHQDEGLVGYPALPHQRRTHEWSQQLAA